MGSIAARYAGGGAPGPLASAQQMLVAGATLVVIGASRGERPGPALAGASAQSLLAFGYLTVFGSLVAFSAFGWLLKVSTPARVSTVAYVNPLVVVLGWALLGERLGPRALAGAAVLVAAVVLMTVQPRRAPHV